MEQRNEEGQQTPEATLDGSGNFYNHTDSSDLGDYLEELLTEPEPEQELVSEIQEEMLSEIVVEETTPENARKTSSPALQMQLTQVREIWDFLGHL